MNNFYVSAFVAGNNILYTYIENGKRQRRKIDYFPSLFLPSNKPSKYSTIYGKPVEKITPGNLSDAREFLKQYEGIDGFEIYGNTGYNYCFLSDEFPNQIEWNSSDLNVAIIDIEVESENGFAQPEDPTEKITAITLKTDGVYYTFGYGDFSPDPGIKYIKCRDEIELLREFINTWRIHCPDIVTGWNCKFYDFPYLINRIEMLLGEKLTKSLSPWNRIYERKVTMMGKEQQAYEILGVAILDYKELFRKFAKEGTAQESFTLNNIAHVTIGEKKIDYSEFDNLHQLYKKDYQKFMKYNIHDCVLIERMDDKLKLIELALTLAYNSRVNFEDVLAQTRMWDCIIFDALRKEHQVVPQKRHTEKTERFKGGYVKEPIPGLYKWLVSIDATSLYPSLFMFMNISPESLVQPEEYTDEIRAFLSQGITIEKLLNKEIDTSILKKYNYCLTGNLQLFKMDKISMMSKVTSGIFDSRKKYKNLMMDNKRKLEAGDGVKEIIEKLIAKFDCMQNSFKVTNNSLFGAAGNNFFRWYDIRIAEAITKSGQLVVQWTEKKINEYLNKLLKTEGKDFVVAMDTDSLFMCFDDLVQKYFDKHTIDTNPTKIINFLDSVFKEKIHAYLISIFNELAEYLNAFPGKIDMKREAIANKAIWTGKKHYVLNVWDNEGVRLKEPKIKYVGLETNKSSTPMICRTKLKEAIKMILDKDQESLISFKDNFYQEFIKLSPEDVAFPRGVNGIAKYKDGDGYKLKTPIHVKAALAYNNILVEKKLKQYQKISDGEKLKYLFLKTPNRYKTPVLAFLSRVPKEFEIDNLVNYREQFEKAFLSPLRAITDVIGWELEKVNTLDSFFE